MLFPVAVSVLAALSGAAARDIFVSPTGTGTGTGTLDAPLGSVQSAVAAAVAGDTILPRKAHTRRRPTFKTPKALGEALPNPEKGVFHIQNANYWALYDLEIINGPYGIYARDASHSYYDGLSTACRRMTTTRRASSSRAPRPTTPSSTSTPPSSRGLRGPDKKVQGSGFLIPKSGQAIGATTR
ncbi:Pectate disaccharide-lyase [Colletotrichum shisoi]|uniref:Pectate disaccharide-lyase n=1 Tax=Colletotrichum shisoi TaxID=2078593 RepID=A0A5Q4BNA8_9PEZI|nr:Pectate disaccharide-lyase [Colletotrichum shisoi]